MVLTTRRRCDARESRQTHARSISRRSLTHPSGLRLCDRGDEADVGLPTSTILPASEPLDVALSTTWSVIAPQRFRTVHQSRHVIVGNTLGVCGRGCSMSMLLTTKTPSRSTRKPPTCSNTQGSGLQTSSTSGDRTLADQLPGRTDDEQDDPHRSTRLLRRPREPDTTGPCSPNSSQCGSHPTPSTRFATPPALTIDRCGRDDDVSRRCRLGPLWLP